MDTGGSFTGCKAARA